MHRVFVYGSLLSGLGNHGLLFGSKRLGLSHSPKNFAMVDLGYFPGVVIDESHPGDVIGEVYEVDDATLSRLDKLEGYRGDSSSNFYDRKEIDTEYGKAYIYIYSNRYGRVESGYVDNGDWRTHLSNKIRSERLRSYED